jgi:hypothetical protein
MYKCGVQCTWNRLQVYFLSSEIYLDGKVREQDPLEKDTLSYFHQYVEYIRPITPESPVKKYVVSSSE